MRAVLDAGYEVSTVPGPAALIAALVSSGLPTIAFRLRGVPAAQRRGRAGHDWREIAGEPRTVVLYEAPHRVVRTIADLTEACGPDRPVAVARELTKLYETVVRGTLGDGRARRSARRVRDRARRGAGRRLPRSATTTIAAAVDAELAGGASTRDAAARVAVDARCPPATRLRHRRRPAQAPLTAIRVFPATASATRRDGASGKHSMRIEGSDLGYNTDVSEYVSMASSGPSAAFFDLDRTLISGSSAFVFATAARRAGSAGDPPARSRRDVGVDRSSCAAPATTSRRPSATASSAPSPGCARTTSSPSTPRCCRACSTRSAPRPDGCSTSIATPGGRRTSCRRRRSRSSSRWRRRSA